MIQDTFAVRGRPCLVSLKQIGTLLIISLVIVAAVANTVDFRRDLRGKEKSGAGGSLRHGAAVALTATAGVEAEVETQARNVRSPLRKAGHSTDLDSEFAIFTHSGALPSSLACLVIEYVAEVSKEESRPSTTYDLPPKGTYVSVEDATGRVLLCSARNDALQCTSFGRICIQFPLEMYLGPICPKPSRRVPTAAASDEHRDTAAYTLAVLPADHPFTLWSNTTYGASTCTLTWSGPTCVGAGESHSWDWIDFDGLTHGYAARNLALSYGHYRFLTIASGSTRVTCGFAENCHGVSGLGVTITTLDSKTFDAKPTVVGAAFKIRFSGTLNRPEVVFDPIPQGMQFLVPTDELTALVGGSGRSQISGQMSYTADGGFVAIAKTGIGAGNVRFEYKDTNDD